MNKYSLPPPLLKRLWQLLRREYMRRGVVNWMLMLRQIRRLPPQTSQENGNHPTRQIHLHFLWKDHREAHLCRDLGMPVLQKVRCWWGLGCFVCSLIFPPPLPAPRITLMGAIWGYSTPAAAATRSTIRRLREIAEV